MLRCKSESEAFNLGNRLSGFTVLRKYPQCEFIFTVMIVIRTVYGIKVYPFSYQLNRLNYSLGFTLPIVKVRRSEESVFKI